MIGGEDMYKPMCRECYHTTAQEIERIEAQMATNSVLD
jgi:thymidine kinase